MLIASLSILRFSSCEMVSRNAMSEDCLKKNGEIRCIWSFTETLTLLPTNEVYSLLLKDDKGLVLGRINFALKSFKMRCEPAVERWIRSYKVNVETVKSCPGEGGCVGGRCVYVNDHPDEQVKELEQWKNNTGFNRCSGSCSFLWCNCGTAVGSSCLFYRIFAEPISPDIFEIFSCKWIPLFEVEMELDTLKDKEEFKKDKNLLVLHPGMAVHWSNLTITVTQFSLPPEPEMGKKLISNGKFVSLIDDIHSDIQCASFSQTETFKCKINEEVCENCITEHDAEKVVCKCRDERRKCRSASQPFATN